MDLRKTKHFISINLLCVAYLLIASSLSNLSNLPDVMKSVLALPSFVIIPYLFGSSLLLMIKKRFSNVGAFSKFILFWWCGIIAMFFFAFTLDILGFFDIAYYSASILLVAIASSIFESYKKIVQKENERNNLALSSEERYRIILSILIGLIPAIFYLTFLPFPQQYHNVLPSHNRVVLDILGNAPYAPLSCNFSYLMTPYLLMAVPSFIFGLKPHILFWAMPLIFYSLFSIGINSFSYQLSKNKFLALLASYIGVWIMTYEGGFQENYSFTPRAFLYMLFPFALFLVMRKLSEKEKIDNDIRNSLLAVSVSFLSFFAAFSLLGHLRLLSSLTKEWQIIAFFPFLIYIFLKTTILKESSLFPVLFLTATIFLMFHNFESVLYVFVLFLYVVSCITFAKPRIVSGYCLITFSFLIVLLQGIGILRFPVLNLSSYLIGGITSNWNFIGFWWVYSIFVNANTLWIFMLFLVGSFVIPFINTKNLPIFIASSITFLFYFLPDPFAYRIGATLAPFLVFTVALLLFRTFSGLIHRTWPYLRGLLRRNITTPQNYLHSIALILTIILVTPVIIQPIQYHHHKFFVAGFEYQVVDFFWNSMTEDNQKNTIVISDVRTATIISGLTYIQSPVLRLMTEEEYSSEAKEQIDHIKHNVFAASDPQNAYDGLKGFQNIEHSQVIIAITGRTLQWLENPEDRFLFYEISYISDHQNAQIILSNFYDTRYFSSLIEIKNQIYIFALR